jgi:hypothetical protein
MGGFIRFGLTRFLNGDKLRGVFHEWDDNGVPLNGDKGLTESQGIETSPIPEAIEELTGFRAIGSKSKAMAK